MGPLQELEIEIERSSIRVVCQFVDMFGLVLSYGFVLSKVIVFNSNSSID